MSDTDDTNETDEYSPHGDDGDTVGSLANADPEVAHDSATAVSSLEELQARWRKLSEDPSGDPIERDQVFTEIAAIQGTPANLKQ